MCDASTTNGDVIKPSKKMQNVCDGGDIKHGSYWSCIISKSKKYVYVMKKAISIKLNDHYANLMDGSCPSHHSPNNVIPFINDNTCLWSGNITIFD